MANPIFCAIDTKDTARAKTLVRSVAPYVGGIKLGLEFFTANGIEGVKAVMAGVSLPLFLDLKFHDIPNTVAEAVRSAIRHLDVAMLTIHTSGGAVMMQAAAKAAKEESLALGKAAPLVVGVTVLTSMGPEDLHGIGIATPVEEQVKRLALLAEESGLDGVVCSAAELPMIRQVCRQAFKTVVPGIRPEGASTHDQKRVMTPKQALAAGADYLVIGRPITDADDPAQAARAML